jgi:hypothetical protein
MKSRLSFNHLVRGSEQRSRYGEAENLGSLEIDDQFELGGLLDRQVARSCALEDFIDVGRSAAKQFNVAWRIGYEPPASTYSLYGYIEGSWFAAANSTIRFR